MPAPNTISVDKMSRLMGKPSAPIVIDVRIQDDFASDPRILPAAILHSHEDVLSWGPDLRGRNVVVVCQRGAKLSHGVAAWLRHFGVDAVSLVDGFEGWKTAGLPLIPFAKLPKRNEAGQTVWVTRARPKIDRIACPWLIRRFVDPNAAFLFVAPSEVEGVAARFEATAFDVENAFWSHREDGCTFDVMLEEFGLATEPLLHLAKIVRAADTARFELALEAHGLLAVSLGLSRMFSDDLEQLDAGLLLYDAFYRWCRDATEETHTWSSHKPKS